MLVRYIVAAMIVAVNEIVLSEENTEKKHVRP